MKKTHNYYCERLIDENKDTDVKIEYKTQNLLKIVCYMPSQDDGTREVQNKK